jgi:imidazolonepropionase-like amidohydrolase
MAIEIRARYCWDGRAAQAGNPVAVRIEGERIRAVTFGPPAPAPAVERVLDFGEATILPGLVDMHTHFGISQTGGDLRAQMHRDPVPHILAGAVSLWEDLESGVTAAKLNGDREFFDVQMRDAVRAGVAEAPRLFVSGRGIKSSRCSGGVVASSIADTPDAVRRYVRENLDAGVDWVKLFANGRLFGPREAVLAPSYGLAEIAAAAELAHAAGKPISVHCFGGEAADACLEAKVDVVEHGSLLSEAQLDRMARQGTRLTPTVGHLIHPEGSLARLPDGAERDAARRRADEALAAAASAIRLGVPVLAGTDAMHGGLAYELHTLQALGATPRALLAAATSEAAAVLGCAGTLGAVREEALADLVVVRGDATRDVHCLAEILLVVRGGKLVHRAGATPAYRTN